MLYDTTINGRSRKVVGHFARNGFYYSLDRTNGEFLLGGQYVNDLNWTKGLNPKTGKPLDYDPKLDVQIYNPAARALRGDVNKRSCPTWHGGIAHQPTAYNPVKHIAYGVGIEGCFTQNGAAVKYLSPEGGIDEKGSEKRTYSSDLYYGSITAFDTIGHKTLAKVVTDIEVRSGATATAGGVMFTALQDGWVVAYNDETLEELWRFNVGTPLKGAPVTYAIGPKQYPRRAVGRPPSASREVRQAGELQLSVRVCAELRAHSPELDTMPKSKSHSVGRRGFLRGAAATAALVVRPPNVDAQTPPARSATPLPSPAQVASETSPPPPRTAAYTVERPGSDFMVDVIKSLGFEYIAANPGSSFRGLHESIINYGSQQQPRALDVLPRGIVGRDGARLRQDRRQADDGHGSRHGRPAACVDGHLGNRDEETRHVRGGRCISDRPARHGRCPGGR